MRKFVLIAAVAGLALLGLHFWSNPEAAPNAPRTAARDTATPTPWRSTAAAPSPITATPSPTASTGPYGGTEEARKVWEPIVQGFALTYPDTAGHTTKEWLANLRPYLTKEVIDALAATDLDQVPAGHYAGYQTLEVGDDALTVRVTYQEGWALVLYIAATGHDRWIISSFDTATDWDD